MVIGALVMVHLNKLSYIRHLRLPGAYRELVDLIKLKQQINDLARGASKKVLPPAQLPFILGNGLEVAVKGSKGRRE